MQWRRCGGGSEVAQCVWIERGGEGNAQGLGWEGCGWSRSLFLGASPRYPNAVDTQASECGAQGTTSPYGPMNLTL
jgi:hypothetical protein